MGFPGHTTSPGNLRQYSLRVAQTWARWQSGSNVWRSNVSPLTPSRNRWQATVSHQDPPAATCPAVDTHLPTPPWKLMACAGLSVASLPGWSPVPSRDRQPPAARFRKSLLHRRSGHWSIPLRVRAPFPNVVPGPGAPATTHPSAAPGWDSRWHADSDPHPVTHPVHGTPYFSTIQSGLCKLPWSLETGWGSSGPPLAPGRNATWLPTDLGRGGVGSLFPGLGPRHWGGL
jgi:hypothetical protein